MNVGRPRTKKPEGRRQRGSGGVLERRPGLWEGSLSRTVNGQRERRKFYAGSKAEVEDRIERAKVAWRDGQDIRPRASREVRFADTDDTKGDTLTGVFADKWLRDECFSTNKGSTFELNRCNVTKHIKSTGYGIASVPLNRLLPARISKLLADMARAGVSGRVCQSVRQTLSQVLATAVAWGYVTHNACADVSKPKHEAKEIMPWQSGEVREFLKAAREHRLYPLFVLAIHSGLRIAEVLGLRWADVDFETGLITVSGSISKVAKEVGGEIKVGYQRRDTTKTKRGKRELPLLPEARKALLDQKAAQVPERTKPTDLVFSTASGRHLNPSNVRRDFNDLIDEAKVRKITFHGLRHTYVTLMHGRGVDHEITMKWTGHKDHRTHQHYNHVTSERETTARLAACKLTLIQGGKEAAA